MVNIQWVFFFIKFSRGIGGGGGVMVQSFGPLMLNGAHAFSVNGPKLWNIPAAKIRTHILRL